MAYIGPIGSVVAFQNSASMLQASITGTVSLRNLPSVSGTVGASVIGLTPVAVTNTPSVSGTVNVGNLPTTQNVSGSVVSFQGTSPWVTSASIVGLTPVAVSNFPTNPSISGTVAISNFPTTQNVSGSVVASGTVGASLIGLSPVSVSNFPTTQNVSGSIVAFQGSGWSGSVAATVTNFPTNQNISGSIVAFQGGTQITSLVSTVPSSVLVGASIIGLTPVNVTNTTINVSGSVVASGTVTVAALQGHSVSGTVQVGNFPTTQNISGSVASFQLGTWNVSVVGTMSGTSSTYAVLSSVTSVSILSANTNRKGATIYNSAGTDVFVKLGTEATTSVFTVDMVADSYYELPYGWTGVVAGISNSNAGVLTVTELT